MTLKDQLTDKTTTIEFSTPGQKPVSVTSKQLEKLAKGELPRQSDDAPKELISKIKIKAREASMLTYSRPRSSGGTEECTLPFYGDIHPDFEAALNALLQIVIETIGLNEGVWTEEGWVSGVSFKHEGLSEIGVTITAQRRTFEGKSSVVNTPFLDAETMSGDLHLLKRILHEAQLCADGKRAPSEQGNLFDQEEA